MLEYKFIDNDIEFTCLRCYSMWSDESAELSSNGEPELPVVCPFCMVSHYQLA